MPRALLAGALAVATLAAGARAEEATCATCHTKESAAFQGSVHRHLACTECHGGEKSYDVPPGGIRATAPPFEHGAAFRGKPKRAAVPELCGDCHADVARMNPYGLRTDQLARYRTSGHGRTLARTGDTRVAVCIDCHGVHDILSAKEPSSPTNPRNVPDTCGRCHGDQKLMSAFHLPYEIPAEYRESVHGKLLLGGGGSGAPSCATCHGNHAAAPPGFKSVHAVCGQCHNTTAERFDDTPHARVDGFAACLQCHGGGKGTHGHHIERVLPPPDELVRRYEALLRTRPTPSEGEIDAAVHPEIQALAERARPGCLECHDEGDKELKEFAGIIDRIRGAERIYVRTASRLDAARRGVLIVDDEDYLFGDARTRLVALAPLQHTLDAAKIDAGIGELREVIGSVDEGLDGKERRLHARHLALIPIWAFALAFAAALYVKYRRLERRWEEAPPHE
jgi:hypothetical protein